MSSSSLIKMFADQRLPYTMLTIDPDQPGAGRTRSGSFSIGFSGPLLKRSGTKGCTFQNRFFVLHGTLLSYFKDASDSIPVGTLVLDKSASLQIPSESARLREFEFHLCLKQKTYYLVAASMTQVNQWVDRISKAIYFAKEYVEIPMSPKSPSWSLLSKAVHRGPLKKQGGSRKSWHERYFVLVAGNYPTLFYFKEMPEGHSVNCLGNIPLTRSYLLPDVSKVIPSPAAFAIMTEDRQFFLEALSVDDRENWFFAFDEVLRRA